MTPTSFPPLSIPLQDSNPSHPSFPLPPHLSPSHPPFPLPPLPSSPLFFLHFPTSSSLSPSPSPSPPLTFLHPSYYLLLFTRFLLFLLLLSFSSPGVFLTPLLAVWIMGAGKGISLVSTLSKLGKLIATIMCRSDTNSLIHSLTSLLNHSLPPSFLPSLSHT